jgi:pyrimidine-nucleoside phosphorylase
MTYTAYQIIDRKKNGKKLSSGELNWFISGLISGEIQDYQASALLMAISIKGMDTAETAALTEVMLKSGRILKFSGNNVVDKHSTGGVGDKASFILGPLAAACGVKVPMIAGRGLGFTGGTIDKIESIPGFQTKMNLDEFAAQLEKTGFVLIGQTEEIAPADKILYAIRDVTATIDSIPLITASIMSKKLAEGANGIVMDIKVGSGAFMGDLKIASALAKSIIQTAKRFKKNAVALLTDMNQPLGLAVGNSLEIIESIETLQGKGPKDLTDLSVELAAHMVFIGKKAKSLALARKMVLEKLHDGSALEKFKELVVEQGGDIKVINNLTKLPLAKTITIVKAKKKALSHTCKMPTLATH